MLVLSVIIRMLLVLTMAQPQPARQTIQFDGLRRQYQVYVPPSYDGSQPVPLLLALHGGGGTIRNMIRLTQGGFDRLADEQGFIVVYPAGVGNYWNDGRAVRGRYSDADDAGFIRALIDHLATRYNIDRTRVFVTGVSNGGHMSYRLACDLSDQIAGIAPVIALMPDMQEHDCAPTHPLGVLIIAGTDDPLVPYNGGAVMGDTLRRGSVASADETARFWAEANGCTGDPLVTELPDRDLNDGSRIRHTVYNGCTAPVELYTVIGGGHTWAGGWQYLPERIIGKTSREIDANQVIWEFFRSLAAR